MRRFNRAEEPAICTTHSARWNTQWVERRKTNPNAVFNWYQVEGISSRDHMMPRLREQTQQHCSFCDAFPVEGVSNETIEHFRPQSRFPDRAYVWSNLYYCCDACQTTKREQWDDRLLHADAEDYQFSKYFEFDFTNGQIRPNPLASEPDQQRATVTLKLYGLDSPGRRRNRLDEARRFTKCAPGEIANELWAYRDFLAAS
jgi:uncharacterized protein (TIGR02646 family)